MARALTPDDARALVDLYEDYEWWEDRTVGDVRTALTETDVALGVEEDGTLVAAARVLTDYRYYANVFDVIVAADRRGEGVGERLLRAVVDHRALQDVDGLSLLCRRGLVPFYESVGFEPFDANVDVPEGGREELVRMVLPFDDRSTHPYERRRRRLRLGRDAASVATTGPACRPPSSGR